VDEIGCGGVTDVDGGVAAQVEQVIEAVLLDHAMVHDRPRAFAEEGLFEIELRERPRRKGQQQYQARNSCQQSHAMMPGTRCARTDFGYGTGADSLRVIVPCQKGPIKAWKRPFHAARGRRS
jgi:hypothetical protein